MLSISGPAAIVDKMLETSVFRADNRIWPDLLPFMRDSSPRIPHFGIVSGLESDTLDKPVKALIYDSF
ncbi:MAG TPA: hypothetical protein DHW63_06695 [Hyphomonadaceae bacterium]|nr:hypothetical protein [Hyphomonadaceae bacterium]